MKSEAIKKSFTHTLFSLPRTGVVIRKNAASGSIILLKLPRLSRIFQKNINPRYIPLTIGFSVVLVEPIDDFGIRRRKKGNAEKYKKLAFQCKL